MQYPYLVCLLLFLITAGNTTLIFSISNRQKLDTKKKTLPYHSTEYLAKVTKQQLQKQGRADSFLLGISTSEHQCSQQCSPKTCSWSRFAQQHHLPQPNAPSYTMNWWENYQQYIDFIKHTLHANACRFSIEWALVQPQNAEHFDQRALNHYAHLFLYAIQQGITPIICLHHYTDPCWFIDRGGFEKEKNIAYFVNFCTKVYAALIETLIHDHIALQAYRQMAPRQTLWATFNSPEGYAFKGYHTLTAPPANKQRQGLQWTCTVLKNMLEAHVQTYYALKKEHMRIDRSKIMTHPCIGFLKNIYQLEPAHNTLLQKICMPMSALTCIIGNMIQRESIYRFFTTGIFTVSIPTIAQVNHINYQAPQSLDFIGLNYYSNGKIFLTKAVQEKKLCYKTDNPQYRIYPYGLYRAIVELSEKLALPLNIPLYVTENGIATQNDAQRSHFYHTYLHALCTAIAQGYPVYGYLTWTLADNYEWPTLESQPLTSAYGLCTTDPHNRTHLVLKQGSLPYLLFANHFTKSPNF